MDINVAEAQLPETQFLETLTTRSASPTTNVIQTPTRQQSFVNSGSATWLRQLRVRASERLELIRWCVGNQQLYRDGPRQQFWEELRVFFAETYNREIKSPDHVIRRMVKSHRKKQAALLRDFGRAESETDLDQALDQWIEIVDDTERNKREAREAAAASEENEQTVARCIQDSMMERMRNKRRLRDPSSDSELEEESQGSRTNDSRSPLPRDYFQSPIPRNSRSRARRRLPLSPEEHAEVLQKGMENVLSPLAAAVESLAAANREDIGF
ncbi:hypothetical protein AJ80_06666 [Polytolypa hystricis UAMH7299]|uniref:Uncharacterized protein n=1 Tax=Polytolypa hystricis (strain UAMH7299) TaxID=1447883 RepID=A0A2B7XVS9_POLH7|nr:hypothetical protein AJ80_06666 [Polytolypa hystricis UAMH7299]